MWVLTRPGITSCSWASMVCVGAYAARRSAAAPTATIRPSSTATAPSQNRSCSPVIGNTTPRSINTSTGSGMERPFESAFGHQAPAVEHESPRRDKAERVPHGRSVDHAQVGAVAGTDAVALEPHGPSRIDGDHVEYG